MIELTNICKEYNDKKIFKNFNLKINKQQRLVLLGPNGCGKTTLLKIIANLTSYSGICPKLKCSYIFDQPTLLPNLTIEKNLLLVCKDKHEIRKMINEFRLTSYYHRYPVALSKGQKHRVEIIRGLLYPSDIILMDEPFNSLDLKLKIDLIEKIKQFTEDKTVVFITHNIDEAISFGDRIVALNEDGKIIFDHENDCHIKYGENRQVRQKIIEAILA